MMLSQQKIQIRQKIQMFQRINRRFNYKLTDMSVTLTLIFINIIIELISIYMFFFKGIDLGDRFGLLPEAVFNGQYDRLFTSMFLHADLAHIGSNMFALFCMGYVFEQRSGKHRHLKMLVTYFVSGICGSLLVLFTSEPEITTVGASGCIFGVMGAAFIMMIKYGSWYGIRALLLNLAVNISATFHNEGISVAGHMGGLAGGLIMGAFLISERDRFSLN